MNTFKDLQDHLKKANTLEWLIYINVFFYIVVFVAKDTMGWFDIASDPSMLYVKPWSLLSYAFIHLRFFHLLSNLIVLYYIGNVFLNFFSKKKLVIYYVMGALVGGVSFIVFFYFQNKLDITIIGASAAVSAILVGLAAKIPHYSLRLRFIGSVELWVLSALWIVLSVLATGGVDAGAAVAHLGGAIIGYLLTAYFKEGAIFEKLFVFKNKKKSTFKTVYKNPKAPKTKSSYNTKKQHQRKIDAILDKISKSGYEALTKEEKEFLFNQKD